MKTIKSGKGPAAQLQAGRSILAAARSTDTQVIKPRVVAFERAQDDYSGTHDAVIGIEARLTTAETSLGELDADHNHVIGAMVAALIVDGLPRSNPFEPLGAPSPGALTKMAIADKVKVIRQLLNAVQREKNLRAAAQQVEKLDQATKAVEQGLARIEKLSVALQDARHARDAAAKIWLRELGALKRAARAAADNGAPTLYATLFERPSKPSGKSTKAAPASGSTPAPGTEPASAATPAPATEPAAKPAQSGS